MSRDDFEFVEEDAAAVDVRLPRFLECLGVNVLDYDHARQIVADAASLLGVAAACLDHGILTYISRAGKTW